MQNKQQNLIAELARVNATQEQDFVFGLAYPHIDSLLSFLQAGYRYEVMEYKQYSNIVFVYVDFPENTSYTLKFYKTTVYEMQYKKTWQRTIQEALAAPIRRLLGR